MSRALQPTANGHEAINRLAASQDGIITRQQLLQAGISRHVVARRCRDGILIPVHAGVYKIGPVAGRFGAERAALLACNGGVLSHVTAAVILEILSPSPACSAIDVTLPSSESSRRRGGIRSHIRDLAADEVTLSFGLPVTNAARTLLDLASGPTAELAKALSNAEHRDPAVRERVLALLERYPVCRGSRAMRALLADAAATSFTRSEAEARLLALVKSGGLPRPETNARVAGFEVDFYWPGAGLVVEVDGWKYHGSKSAFVRDRQRDSALIAAGFRVLRLSWHQLTNERDRTLVELTLALGPRTPDPR